MAPYTTFMNYRRKMLLGLLLFLVLLAASSTLTDSWLGFIVLAAMLGVLIIVDFMFMDDTSFIFEPDIKNYARRVNE
jgi:hypothetical protein